MAQQSFQAEVDAWIAKSRKLLEAVLKTSTQFVIEDVVNRTPIQTGFLRASLTVTFDGPLPMRELNPGGGHAPRDYSLTINSADLDDTIYASFVANYAAHVEYGARGRAGVGMVRLAAQNWQQHVNRAAAMAKARVR